MLVVILVVVLILAGLAGLVLWIRRAAACRRLIGEPGNGDPDDVFFGGILCKGITTSGSMVRLETFDWGVQVRGMKLTRWVVPTWQARYDEIALGELVVSAHSRNAVWLRLRGTTDGMGFLGDRTEAILKMLEARDVPVDRAVTRIKNVSELYR